MDGKDNLPPDVMEQMKKDERARRRAEREEREEARQKYLDEVGMKTSYRY